MIEYFLGVITGAVLSLIVFLVALLVQPKVGTKIRQFQSRVAPKGAILEPESEELEQWLKDLPKDVSV